MAFLLRPKTSILRSSSLLNLLSTTSTATAAATPSLTASESKLLQKLHSLILDHHGTTAPPLQSLSISFPTSARLLHFLSHYHIFSACLHRSIRCSHSRAHPPCFFTPPWPSLPPNHYLLQLVPVFLASSRHLNRLIHCHD